MSRAALVLAALIGLASLPSSVFAQEADPIDECAPETLFQAMGLEENPNCPLPEDEATDEDQATDDEGVPAKNPVSTAAKLPGNNREAAQAHAFEMSGGKAGGHGGGNDRQSDQSSSEDGNGKSKKH